MSANLPGACQATAAIEETIEKQVSFEVNAYSSAATDAGEGCLLDIDLSVMGEEKEGETDGCHWTRLSVQLDKSQARVLRDLLNTFLAMT